MPRRRSGGRVRGRRSSVDDEELEAKSGALDELDLFREAHAAREREAVRLAERDAAQKELKAARRELEVAVVERDEAVAAARRDAQALLGLQARVVEIDRRVMSVDGALLAAGDRVQELERLVGHGDQELEDQALVLEELDRQVDAAREREDVRLAELRGAQKELEAAVVERDRAVVERDRAVAAARRDAQALLGLQARVVEIDRRVVSVDGDLLAAAGRVRELEQVVGDEDQALEDQRWVLEELDRQVDAAREREDVRLAELRAVQKELEAARQEADARVGQRDEERAAAREPGDLVAQLQHRTAELQQRVDGMNSSLSSTLERATGLEVSAHEATNEAARLQTDIEALSLQVDHEAAAGAAGDPERSAEIQALLDELRKLLANAMMQAEAAAEDRTRLERQLKLLEGNPQQEEPPK
jgi:chromosome segregation ATPase